MTDSKSENDNAMLLVCIYGCTIQNNISFAALFFRCPVKLAVCVRVYLFFLFSLLIWSLYLCAFRCICTILYDVNKLKWTSNSDSCTHNFFFQYTIRIHTHTFIQINFYNYIHSYAHALYMYITICIYMHVPANKMNGHRK